MASRFFGIGLVFVATLFFVSQASAGDCPSKFDQLSLSGGSATCNCKTGGGGSVWGTGTYTADSNLCAAARHAGAIGSSGGEVTFKKSSGCGAYTGSSANSISTSSWTSHNTSFYVDGFGNGSCSAASGGACPTTAKGKSGEISCECSKNPSGTIYGTTVYTIDSNICAAALHSGAIDSSGGKVKLKTKGGCIRYQATESNGVTSASWGEYHSSFYFVGTTDGACP